jgi:hypothetical protein
MNALACQYRSIKDPVLVAMRSLHLPPVDALTDKEMQKKLGAILGSNANILEMTSGGGAAITFEKIVQLTQSVLKECYDFYKMPPLECQYDKKASSYIAKFVKSTPPCFKFSFPELWYQNSKKASDRIFLGAKIIETTLHEFRHYLQCHGQGDIPFMRSLGTISHQSLIGGYFEIGDKYPHQFVERDAREFAGRVTMSCMRPRYPDLKYSDILDPVSTENFKDCIILFESIKKGKLGETKPEMLRLMDEILDLKKI